MFLPLWCQDIFRIQSFKKTTSTSAIICVLGGVQRTEKGGNKEEKKDYLLSLIKTFLSLLLNKGQMLFV